MPVDPRTPCIIGVAQRTIRAGERPSPEPLALWDDVCRSAAADAHATGDVLASADSLAITFCQSYRYDDPTGRLAARLGFGPGDRHYTSIGGHTGLALLARASTAILDGTTDVAVLCGAETLATMKAAMRTGEQLDWSFPHPEGTTWFPPVDLHPGELSCGLALNAPAGFSVFDSARRAHLGTELDDYRREIATLFSGMTEVAERNPNAWFPRRHDAEFLYSVSDDNRMVGYPYTKHTVAIMDVDMAAAVIVASTEAADRLGVPAEQRIYPHGWCAVEAPPFAAQHPELFRISAMQAAADEALRCAGMGIDDIAHVDLYSCFGSAVNLARDVLGIHDRAGDRLTVTGGLPYAGGPASNYMMHSIAAMTDVLREDRAAFGLVSGVGMLMGKHAFGVLGSAPPGAIPRRPVEPEIQAQVDAMPRREVVVDHTGPGTVAAYSVAHDRNGPSFGIAICDLPDGARTYARFDDPDLMAEAEVKEFVGQDVGLVGAGDFSNLIV